MMLSDDKCKKYLSLAENMANTFSKDPSTKVGALFLAENSHQILSMGYNGMPRGFDESIVARWDRPQKYMYVEHAERNAIYNACRNGTSLENSTAVVTMYPCSDCMRALIQSGIKEVVTYDVPQDISEKWKEIFEYSKEMAEECGVNIKKFNNDF